MAGDAAELGVLGGLVPAIGEYGGAGLGAAGDEGVEPVPEVEEVLGLEKPLGAARPRPSERSRPVNWSGGTFGCVVKLPCLVQ